MIDLPKDLDLANPEFLKVWNLLRHTSTSIFLTGKAGTGKSTFLRYICENTKKNYVVLAPTGIAAVNVGGMTLHSFFKIPLRPLPPDDPDYLVSRILRTIKFPRSKIKLIRKTELLIIDEISMVRADIMDFIDRILRAIGDRRLPFGGKQLLLVGDIFQLEPVVTADVRNILSRYYSDFFFFNALAYRQIPLVSIELKKVYRQKDDAFIDLLDRIRMNRVTPSDLQVLNSRTASYDSIDTDETDFRITLATRRDLVDSINERCLEHNPNEEHVFHGIIEGEFPEKSLPTDLHLRLKKGVQVIMLRNDPSSRWVNGTLAMIDDIRENAIVIVLENGEKHTVDRDVWENVRYSFDEKEKRVVEEVIGRFFQFPVKAAWAITVHKSQGLTFNRVAIEMGMGAFSPGQTYVALSRCRSLEGISFLSPLSRRDVMVSRQAVDFSTTFNDDARINSALEAARSKILYAEALEHFNNVEIEDAVEKASDALMLTGDLKRPEVRRFIAQRLRIISRMKREIETMRAEMEALAMEFVEMGYDCLNAEGASEAALSNFNKALRLYPKSPEAIIGRVRTLLKMERFIEAESDLQAVEREKSIPSFDLSFLRGQLCEADDSPEDALLHYTAAHKSNKKCPEIHDALARIYVILEMEDMADFHRSKARKLRETKDKKKK